MFHLTIFESLYFIGFCEFMRAHVSLVYLFMEIWAPELIAKTITLRSDNQATCAWLTRKCCDILVGMNLLRHLTKTCLLFQIDIKARYIKMTDNTFSYLISRDWLAEFHALYPSVDKYPQSLPLSLWPPQWNRQDMHPCSSPSSCQHKK